MEANKAYQGVLEKIGELEEQLRLCDQPDTTKYDSNIESQIEEHFQRCINALAARKAELLAECATKQRNSRDTKKLAVTLQDLLEGSKKSLETGSIFFKTDVKLAENVWNATISLQVPSLHKSNISVVLPDKLIETIHCHGAVVAVSSYAKVKGKVATFAGSTSGNEDNIGLAAKMSCPSDICWNTNDNCLYLCDGSNNSIRRLTLQGEVQTVVKSTQLFSSPYGIAVHNASNTLYVSNQAHNTISTISASGAVKTLVGVKTAGFQDGKGEAARFNIPTGVAVNQKTGDLYVCDQQNHAIRVVTQQGEVSTLAGASSGFMNGVGKAACFTHPVAVHFDEQTESLLVCDTGNGAIRRVLLNGEVSTLCTLKAPTGITVTSDRTVLIITETGLYKTSQDTWNKVELIAGSNGDESQQKSSFNGAYGIVVHEPSHSCFITERRGHTVLRVFFE